jgi:hypothetical protein
VYRASFRDLKRATHRTDLELSGWYNDAETTESWRRNHQAHIRITRKVAIESTKLGHVGVEITGLKRNYRSRSFWIRYFKLLPEGSDFISFLCFSDRASWCKSIFVTNLMHLKTFNQCVAWQWHTRWCIIQLRPPDDERCSARNMLRW